MTYWISRGRFNNAGDNSKLLIAIEGMGASPLPAFSLPNESGDEEVV